MNKALLFTVLLAAPIGAQENDEFRQHADPRSWTYGAYSVTVLCGDEAGRGCFLAPLVFGSGGVVFPDTADPWPRLVCDGGRSIPLQVRVEGGVGIAVFASEDLDRCQGRARVFLDGSQRGGWYWLNHEGSSAVLGLAEVKDVRCNGAKPTLPDGVTVLDENGCAVLIESVGKVGLLPRYARANVGVSLVQ